LLDVHYKRVVWKTIFLVRQQNRRISWYIIDYGIYGMHYVSTIHCFIVFQEIKTCTLYNVVGKEEWEFKKNIYVIFNRSMILYERPKNDFQSWVARFDGVKLCL